MESAACWLAAMLHSLAQTRGSFGRFYIELSFRAKLGTSAKQSRRWLRAPDLTEISFRITFLTLEAVVTPSGRGEEKCFYRPENSLKGFARSATSQIRLQ
jgi:hypothetical protein